MQVLAAISIMAVAASSYACTIANTSGSAGASSSYITSIVANGTNVLVVGSTTKFGNVTTYSNITLTTVPGITVTGSWSGTKITRIAGIGCSGNTCLDINNGPGAGGGRLTFGQGTQSGFTGGGLWTGTTGGVNKIFGTPGTPNLTFEGLSDDVGGLKTSVGRVFGNCNISLDYDYDSNNKYVLKATATDAISVEFFVNGSSIGVDSSSPFSMPTNLGGSSVPFNAIATFAGGQKTSYNYVALPASVSMGSESACATYKGKVYCWGAGDNGQLGNGSLNDETSPYEVYQVDSAIKVVKTFYGACALQYDGAVKCWGLNTGGILAVDPTTVPYWDEPVLTAAPGQGIIDIAVGDNFICFLTTAGKMKCWGGGSYGEMGNGTQTNINLSAITIFSSGVAKISANTHNVCALLTNGSLKCWGYNNKGQVGVGSNLTFITTPTLVTNMSTGVSNVAVGSYHACAVKAGSTAGLVYCWGNNTYGALGNNAPTSTPRRTPLLSSEFNGLIPDQLTAGDNTTCVLTDTGVPYCLGLNYVGQMGNSTINDEQATKVSPSVITNVKRLEAGFDGTCAVASGHIYCWGSNSSGQIASNSAGDPQIFPTMIDNL